MNQVTRKYPGLTYSDYYKRELERYRLQGFELFDVETNITDENQMPKVLQALKELKKSKQHDLKKAS